jgi:hypothetical protein
MDWAGLISTILGGPAAAAAGGVFGLFGSAVGAWMKLKQARQEHEFEKDRWVYETELQKLQMAGKQAEWENELAVTDAAGSWAGLKESYAAERKAGESYRWVNAIKDLYRPLLTSGLVVLTWVVFSDLMGWLAGEASVLVELFNPQELLDIMKYIVYSQVFAASTAVVWWFGDRAFAPPGMKNR